MDITKEKVKHSGMAGGLTLGLSEYLSAAVITEYPLFVDYQFERFYNNVMANLSNPIELYQNALPVDAFTQIQPILLGASLFVAGKTLFKKTDQYEDASDYGAYGTSRWAKDSEIFDKETITTNMKQEGTIVGVHKGKTLLHRQDSFLNRNIIIVGGSGAGKTRSNIIPNILKNKEKSLLVIDPKGELYEKTSQSKRDQGYEVHLVNFKNRDVSDRYNLFDYIRRDADAFKIADMMVNNAGEGTKVKKDFWNQSQISVLQALILYVKYALPPEQQHMGSVYNLANAPLEIIFESFMEFERRHIVRRAFATAIEKLMGNPKTLSDVFQTLLQTLNPWQYDDVCHFTSANDFLFEDLGKKKMIVYVIMPIADNEFKPLITTFFSQLFSELYRLADNNYGVLPKSVMLHLDEFANVGKIPNFEERLSTTRSLGIEVTLILQDTSQLERTYGKEIAKEIINNCDMRLLLKANEFETAKYFSQLAGKTTIKVKNKSSSNGSKSSTKSESINYMGRDLITPDEVQRLKKNEQLLFIAGQYPLKIKKAWFDQIKTFKHMFGNSVSRDEYPVPYRGNYQAYTPPASMAVAIDLTKELDKALATKEEPKEEVLFVPNVDNKLQKVDTETGEILEELSQEEEPDSLEDLMNNFKF